VTDAIGFICLIPFTRRWLVSRLSKRVSVGSVAGGFTSSGFPPAGGSGDQPAGAQPKRKIDGDVIEGEYTRKD